MSAIQDKINEIDADVARNKTAIATINASKTDLASAITEKGVTVPEGAKLNAMPDLVRAISSGSSFVDIDVKIMDSSYVFTLQESGVKILSTPKHETFSGTIKAAPVFGVEYGWNGIRIKNTGTCYITLGYGSRYTETIIPGKAYQYQDSDHGNTPLRFIAFECTNPNQKLAIQFGGY